jgi:hypothetical protein
MYTVDNGLMHGAEGTPKQKKKLKQAAAATVGAVVDSDGTVVSATEKKVCSSNNHGHSGNSCTLWKAQIAREKSSKGLINPTATPGHRGQSKPKYSKVAGNVGMPIAAML